MEGGDWGSVVEDILARIHSYRVRSRVPGVRPRFVDRGPEIKRILLDSSVFGHGMVTVLYGPKGCGKTELFRALAESVDPGRHHLVVARARRELKREERVVELVRLYAPGGVLEKLGEVLGTLLRRAQVQPLPSGLASISVRGEDVGYAALALARAAIAYRAGIGKVVAVADEASARNTNIFKDWVEGLADTAAEYVEGYAEGGADFSIVVLTSDAIVSEVRHRVGGKVNWALMWNLPREAAEDLAGQLRAFDRVSEELGVGVGEAREILWRLAGGNPRALDIIAADGLEKWLSKYVIEAVKRAIRGYLNKLRGRGGGAGLDSVLKELEEPSPLSGVPPLESPDGFEAAPISDPMLRENVLIDVGAGDPISPMPREPWVGRAYAYQIPAYHYVIKAIHRKRSTDITPRDVLEEALRG